MHIHGLGEDGYPSLNQLPFRNQKERRSTISYFLARHPEDEGETVRDFWEFLQKRMGLAYYVYSHKSERLLKNLMEKYSLDPNIFRSTLKLNTIFIKTCR